MPRLYQRFMAVCLISIALCAFMIYTYNHPQEPTRDGNFDSVLVRRVEMYDKTPLQDKQNMTKPPSKPRKDINSVAKPVKLRPKSKLHKSQPDTVKSQPKPDNLQLEPVKSQPKPDRSELKPAFGELIRYPLNNSEFDFRTNINFKPTTCSVSVQKKLIASPWASEMFMPNITMVMHDGAMSRQEYDRLHYFGMPFGFYFRDELAFTDLQDVLSHLSKVDSILDFMGKERPKCLSCAVIGNGGILNGSQLGKEIDGHDLIFRVNHAIRRGFEQDVGTRTTHYVLMDRSLLFTNKEDVPNDKGIKFLYLPCRRKDYDYVKAITKHRYPTQKVYIDPNDMRILHPDFARYIHKVWMKVKAFRPTTGGMMFMTALHAGCDTVDVYGMGYTKQYSDHYYDLQYRPFKSFLGSHDYRRETELMKDMDRDGIIKWYKRDVVEFL